jgi:hypothetical protein
MNQYAMKTYGRVYEFVIIVVVVVVIIDLSNLSSRTKPL